MKFAALLFAAVALAACGTEDGSTDLVGDATAGETIWNDSSCANCHGADGISGSAGENVVDVAANEASEFSSAVLNGKGNGSMPAFPDLTDQDIADLRAFIATL